MSVWETLFGRRGTEDMPGMKSAPGRFLDTLSSGRDAAFGTSGRDGQPGTPSIFQRPMMGQPGEMLQTQTRTPEQSQAMNQFLQMAMGMLDPSAMEDRAISQYQQQGVPSIMQRFRGLGGQNQASSGMLSALAGGEADLRSQLGAQRFGQGMNLAQLGLGGQFENTYQPAQGGMLKEILPMLLQAAAGGAGGAATGFMAGGPGGALAGGAMGALGSLGSSAGSSYLKGLTEQIAAAKQKKLEADAKTMGV